MRTKGARQSRNRSIALSQRLPSSSFDMEQPIQMYNIDSFGVPSNMIPVTGASAPPDHNAPLVNGGAPGKFEQYEHYVERYQLWYVSLLLLSHPFLMFAAGTRRGAAGCRSILSVTLLSMCGTRRQAVSPLHLSVVVVSH
jgi:hypothetical protein